jgi:hypothetical protein
MYRWNIKRILLVIPTCCVQPRRRSVDPFNRRLQIAIRVPVPATKAHPRRHNIDDHFDQKS